MTARRRIESRKKESESCITRYAHASSTPMASDTENTQKASFLCGSDLIISTTSRDRRRHRSGQGVVIPRRQGCPDRRLLRRCVVLPALDLQFGHALFRQRFDKPLRQLDVGDERNAEIRRFAANQVVVGKFLLLGIFRDIDDKVYPSLGKVLER